MAEKVVGIDIKVNGNEAIKTLGQLEDETKKFNDELKKIESDGGKAAQTVGKSMVDLQAKFEDVYGEMQPLSGRIGEMEDRMYELALAGQQNTEEFKALQSEVSRYKQVIIQTDREVDKLTEQGKLLGGALEIGSTVTAGYGAMQGAMALVGQENEELMQSMVKLQAAQSVLAGVEQLRMNLTKQSLIVTKFQAVQNWVLTGSTTALAGATTVATTGMKLFRLALVATGIGAIVVGLGLLIANFDKVSEAVINGAKWVQNMAQKFREMGAGMQTLIGFLSFGLVPAISYAIKLFEDMGVVDDVNTRKHKENIKARIKDIEKETVAYVNAKKDELKAAQQRFNEEDAALNHQMALMSAAGKSTIEIERKVLQNKRDSIAEQIELTEEMLRTEIKANLEILKLRAQSNDLVGGLLKSINDEIEKQGGQDAYINRVIGDNKDLNELKDTLKKTENEIEIFEVKTNKLKRDAAKKNAEEKDKLRKEELEKDKKKLEDELKARQDAQQKAFELEQKRILDEEAVAEAYRKRQLNAQQKELDDLNEKLNNELLAIGNNEELKLLVEEEFLAKKNEIVNKYIDLEQQAKDKQAQEDLARQLQNIDNVNNAAQTGADFLSNLNAFLSKDSEKNAKREFQINKAKDLAGAVTNTAKGVTQALASSPPPLSFIQAAGIGILGGANIARIASARYGGSDAGGGAVSIPNTASGVGGADVGAVTNTTTTIGGDSKVFVVEQDITNTQNKIQVLENQSKL